MSYIITIITSFAGLALGYECVSLDVIDLLVLNLKYIVSLSHIWL